MFCTCYTINKSTVSITHTELMSRQTHKTPEPIFVQQASVGGIKHHSQMWRTHRDKRFRCSIYKEASLVTRFKPVPSNSWSTVTTKRGKVCGKLPMATKQRNCVSVTCTSQGLNSVYRIHTISNTDNPNKCNEPRTRKQHCILDFTHKAIIVQP